MTTNSMTASAAAAATAAAAAEGDGSGGMSPWPAYVIIGLTVVLGIYIATKGNDDGDIDVFVPPPPVSPA